MKELVVVRRVENDKLKIFVDLYSWLYVHLVELYVWVAISLGLRETPLKSNKKRVRWTCVSLSETMRFRLNYG